MENVEYSFLSMPLPRTFQSSSKLNPEWDFVSDQVQIYNMTYAMRYLLNTILRDGAV